MPTSDARVRGPQATPEPTTIAESSVEIRGPQEEPIEPTVASPIPSFSPEPTTIAEGPSAEVRGPQEEPIEPAVASPIPSFLICPITHDVFRDPVIAMDGVTYERSAIETWLLTHDTSPSFNTPLPSRQILPNLVARNALEWHALSRPGLASIGAVEPVIPPTRRQLALQLIQSRFTRDGWGSVRDSELRTLTIHGQEEYYVKIRSYDSRMRAMKEVFGWGDKAVFANIDKRDAFVTTKGFHMYYWNRKLHDVLGVPRTDEYAHGEGSKQEFSFGHTIWTEETNCYHVLD